MKFAIGNLVKLPNGNFVNPAHVTCIELENGLTPPAVNTRLWVKKDAGYGTGSFVFPGDQRAGLAAIVNGEALPS